MLTAAIWLVALVFPVDGRHAVWIRVLNYVTILGAAVCLTIYVNG